jgi:protoporphyrinogen/coproporphyrinogen III oxidase
MAIRMRRIAIIGGGIAGISAAYEIEKARTRGEPVGYSLFESRPRLGGTLASETLQGVVLERGPDSFLTEKAAALELCRELELGDDLVFSNDDARTTWIVVGNRLIRLPDGLMFLVPTKLIPTALTPLFSMSTKLRMGLELLNRPRACEEDESVAALVKRHYGPEAVDRLADPLLTGVYGGDASQLSAQSVLPRLVNMERQYGSLTRGMLAERRRLRARAQAPTSKYRTAQGGVFATLRAGMQQLVDALAARLDPASVRLSTPVTALIRNGDRWRVQADGRDSELYDGVIAGLPAWAAGELLAAVDLELGTDLRGIPYSSSITVNMVYHEAALGPLPAGFGFLVPASEGRAMLACTFAHRKFLGRTPPGKAVLRAFLGGTRNEAMLAESDAALVATVRRELSEILGAATMNPHLEPEYVELSRWPRSMAQYVVGHRERVARIQARVAVLPGLRLAGNAYDGIGVPDCIRLGRQAARELIALGTGAPV